MNLDNIFKIYKEYLNHKKKEKKILKYKNLINFKNNL